MGGLRTFTSAAVASLACLTVLGGVVGSPIGNGSAFAEIPNCSSGWAALTYDDGPIPDRTQPVLDALEDAGVRATFFAVGYLAGAHPDTVRGIVDGGHRVANHTEAHKNLKRMSSAEIVESIQSTDLAIRAASVDPAGFVRPPYGLTDDRVRGVIESLGFEQVLWDVDPWDWSDISAQTIHDGVVDEVDDGSIVLLHDGDDNYENTAAATSMIIETLHSRGYCFGLLGEGGTIEPADDAWTPPGPFDDIDGSIFHDDIVWLHDEGITDGYNLPDGNLFCPQDPVTRGEMAAFIARTLGLTDQRDDPFTDDDGSTFEDDIEKLAAAGVTRGCNAAGTLFCPDAEMTRGEMAAFVVRAFGYVNDGGGDLFADDDGSIFEADIERLATAGVTYGCSAPPDPRFCPEDPVTRGQMAAFLHRAATGTG